MAQSATPRLLVWPANAGLHADQEDLGQGITHPARAPLILDLTQLLVQDIQIKEESFVGKVQGRGECCNGHKETFRVFQWFYFTSSYTRKVLFYSLCRFIPDFATALR